MSTFMANKETIVRKWYILDAAGKSLGHTAAQAAAILHGKHKPDYTPHADCGDFVIVLNSDKAVLTGKKTGTEVLSHAFGLCRRFKRDQISPAYAKQLGFSHAPGRQGHAA